MLCTTPAQAGLGADAEYFLNLSIDGTDLYIANHFNSSTDGNWICLEGGDSFSIPSPLTFSFEGINSSTIDMGGHDIDLDFNVLNNTLYTVAYPYDSHRYYTNATGRDEVSFLFNGSTHFAGADVDVHLFNSSADSFLSGIDGITTGDSSAVEGLLNSSLQMSEKTLDLNGDLSASFGTLTPGQYALLIMYVDDTAGTNTMLGITLFDVVTYDCDVATGLDGNNATIDIDLIDAPAGNYTYDTVLLSKSAYATDILLEFNGTRESLDLLINNIIFVDGVNIPNGSIYDLNQSFVRDRLTGMYGANNVSIQHTDAGNSTTFNIDTTNLTLSNYLVFTTVTHDGRTVAFNQDELDLVIHDIDISVNTTSKDVEPSENAVYLVTIENNGNVEESLNITATSPSGVDANLNRTSITLGPGNSTQVTLSVVSDIIGDSYPVTVKATADETSDSIKTYTNVLDPLTVSMDSIHKITVTNLNASYLLTVSNSGNRAHTFNLSVVSQANAFLNLSTVTLSAGDSQDVLLNVSSPVEGLFTTQVTVNNSQDTDTLTVLTNVGTAPVHSIELTSNTQSLTLEPGAPTNYQIVLENTGNVNETVYFSVIAPPEVKASLITSSKTLTPGQTFNNILTVASENIGGPYSVTVHAASDSASDDLVTRTTFITPIKVVANANKKTVLTNQPANYSLTVTNTGTMAHTFNLNATCNATDSLSNTSLNLGPGNSSTVTYSVSSGTTGTYDSLINVNYKYTSLITLSDAYIHHNLSMSTRVDTRPVYGVSLSSNTSTQSVNTGVNATYELTILNTGNVNDSFDLTLNNPRADVAVLNDSTPVYLVAGQQTTRLLTVSSANGGTCDVTVTASSGNSSRSAGVTTITKVSSHGLLLSAGSVATTTTPNTTATLTLSLKNLGNVADNFTLTSQSTNNTVSMPSTLTSVAAGETREFKVTLFSSDVGTSVSTIKATSQGDTSKRASKALILTVNPAPVYSVSVSVRDPIATIEQNEDLSYLVNVKNNGNVNDTYTVSSTSANADISAASVSLLPGQTGTLVLNVTGLATPGSYVVPVTVTSQTQSTASSVSYAHIDVSRIASVIITPGSQTVKGSDPSVYDIKVTNTGTQAHDYRFSKLSSSANTTLTISPATIYDLESGESAHVELTFNNTGASDRRIAAKLNVHDLANPLKSTGFSINTLYLTADIHGVDLKSDTLTNSINSGNDATYSLTVFNLGNVNETFTLAANRGTLSASAITLGPGESEFVTFTDSPTASGDYVSRIVASSANASDSLRITTRVLEVQEEYIFNSQVDELSSVTDSNVTDSTVVNSLITDSTIQDSHIEASTIDNCSIMYSDMENILLKDAYVRENFIYNGTVTLDDVEYNVLASEYPDGATIDQLLQGEDSFENTLAGTPGEKTEIEAPESNVTLQISSNESFVGGSLEVKRTSTPSSNTSAPSFSVAGSYLTFEESGNIEEAMTHVVIGFYYDEADLGTLSEDELYMYWYNATNDSWVALEGAGTPDFCLGAGVNTTSNYVWANVTHFSTYTLGGPVASGSTGGSGGSGTGEAEVVEDEEDEISENIDRKVGMSLPLLEDEPVQYSFSQEAHPVVNVHFIPLVSDPLAMVTVEVLKGTSSQLEGPAPGFVYSNFNVISDLSGDEVQDISIDFMVDAAWLQDMGVAAEDIRLYVYDNGWKELETTKTNGLTYNAKTSVFGFFAITGAISEDGQTLPQASFTADAMSGQAPLKVRFTDTSADAVSYSWDFGDGATSVQASPVHTFTDPGTYTVVLTVSNGAGQDTMEMDITVLESEEDTGSGLPFLPPVAVVVILLTAAGLVRRRGGQ